MISIWFLIYYFKIPMCERLNFDQFDVSKISITKNAMFLFKNTRGYRSFSNCTNHMCYYINYVIDNKCQINCIRTGYQHYHCECQNWKTGENFYRVLCVFSVRRKTKKKRTNNLFNLVNTCLMLLKMYFIKYYWSISVD